MFREKANCKHTKKRETENVTSKWLKSRRKGQPNNIRHSERNLFYFFSVFGKKKRIENETRKK